MRNQIIVLVSSLLVSSAAFARDGVLENPNAQQSYFSVGLPTDVQRLGIKGNIHIYNTDADSLEFDQYGNLKRSSSTKNDVQTVYTYENKYDNNGRKVEVVKRMLKPQIKTWVTEYTYNKHGRLEEELHLDESGVYEFARYKYDIFDRLNAIQYYNGEKPKVIKIKVQPNSTKKEKDKKAKTVTINKYDVYGGLVVSETKSKTGDVLNYIGPDSTVVTVKEENGDVFKIVSKLQDGLVVSERKYKSNTLSSGKTRPLRRCNPYSIVRDSKFKYNDKSQIIHADETNYASTLEYDAEGNATLIDIEETKYEITYEYDAMGNRISFSKQVRSASGSNSKGTYQVEYY